jgi:hypothetical protein
MRGLKRNSGARPNRWGFQEPRFTSLTFHGQAPGRRRELFQTRRAAGYFLPESDRLVNPPQGGMLISLKRTVQMSFRHRRTRRLVSPEQLELPLDYSRSERGALSRNPLLLKGKRLRPSQDHLAIGLAMLGQRDTVLATCSPYKRGKYFRQHQRFLLTSLISTVITNVNENSWRWHVSTLPPLESGTQKCA